MTRPPSSQPAPSPGILMGGREKVKRRERPVMPQFEFPLPDQELPKIVPAMVGWNCPLSGHSLCHQDPNAEDRKRTFGSRRLMTSRPRSIGSIAVGAAIPIIGGTWLHKRLSLSLVRVLS